MQKIDFFGSMYTDTAFAAAATSKNMIAATAASAASAAMLESWDSSKSIAIYALGVLVEWFEKVERSRHLEIWKSAIMQGRSDFIRWWIDSKHPIPHFEHTLAYASSWSLIMIMQIRRIISTCSVQDLLCMLTNDDVEVLRFGIENFATNSIDVGNVCHEAIFMNRPAHLQVLLAHYSLHYGFSDPHNRKLIRDLIHTAETYDAQNIVNFLRAEYESKLPEVC